RHLWAQHAESERCAAAPRGALEVRLQGREGDREDPLHPRDAAYDLESRPAGRVWLLRQRESRGRSSALEPGARAARWRFPQATHPDVQWLRRSGRVVVQRDGPAPELLTA